MRCEMFNKQPLIDEPAEKSPQKETREVYEARIRKMYGDHYLEVMREWEWQKKSED